MLTYNTAGSASQTIDKVICKHIYDGPAEDDPHCIGEQCCPIGRGFTGGCPYKVVEYLLPYGGP